MSEDEERSRENRAKRGGQDVKVLEETRRSSAVLEVYV